MNHRVQKRASERESRIEVSESVLSVQQSCLCAWLGRCGSFCCLLRLHCSRWGPYVINYVTGGELVVSLIHSKKPMMSGGSGRWHHFHPRPNMKTCEISRLEPRQAFRKLMSARSRRQVASLRASSRVEGVNHLFASIQPFLQWMGSNQESNYAYSQ